MPFGEAALRHFAFLERPEGMDIEDAEGFEAIEQAVALPHDEQDEIVPHLQEFDTIGQLYRSIQAGLEHLAERLGTERLFIGPPSAQATEEHFRWPELVAVTDLASARRAIDTIVEQGEGARGEWRDAHFGRLLGVLDEYLEIKRADPAFEPTRPVVAANVRPQATASPCRSSRIPARPRAWTCSTSSTRSCSSSCRATSPTPTRRRSSSTSWPTSSVGLMYTVIKPLGAIVTTLPVGPDMPGVTAGPGVRALLRGRLPAAAPGSGVGPHGGAAAGRGGVRRPVRRGVHARADGAAGQGGPVAREVRRPAPRCEVSRERRG